MTVTIFSSKFCTYKNRDKGRFTLDQTTKYFKSGKLKAFANNEINVTQK